MIQKTAKECNLSDQDVSNIISGVNSPVQEMVSRIDVDKMVSYDQKEGTQGTLEGHMGVNGLNKRNQKTEQKSNQVQH